MFHRKYKVLSQCTENKIGISRFTKKWDISTQTYITNEILKFYVQSTTLWHLRHSFASFFRKQQKENGVPLKIIAKESSGLAFMVVQCFYHVMASVENNRRHNHNSGSRRIKNLSSFRRKLFCKISVHGF